MIRTGLLGGSFNPAHGGHRRISLFAMDALGLDEVWWLVSPGNPLKSDAGMAPLLARVKSARIQARRAPIAVTAIEQSLDTRYTIDTLRAITVRYPKRSFTWLMGSDNLAQFHRWHRWRDIARTVPIAVIARPGYDASAMVGPAMTWLRAYRITAAQYREGPNGCTPALVMLHFDPDGRSATAIRQADPDWPSRFSDAPVRDAVTHHIVGSAHKSLA